MYPLDIRIAHVAFLMAVLCPAFLFAREITPGEAAIVAQNWLRRSPQPLGTRIVPLSATRPEVRTAVDESGRKLFHMVRVATGTVVTSTDDALPPVIAFTESREIPETEENPLWALLMAGARSRMDSLVPMAAGGGPATLSASTRGNPNRTEWASLLATPVVESGSSVRPLGNGLDGLDDIRVPPLLESKWAQWGTKRPDGTRPLVYNYYTPSNYVCGCVATAIAQVMRYHRFPTDPVRRISRHCFVDNHPVTNTMIGGSYAWDKMPPVPADEPDEDICKALGHLCYDIGVAVSMNWGDAGSGTCGQASVQALKGVFGYTNAMCLISSGYNAIPDTVMAGILRSNFDMGLPTLLSTEGHKIVGDGYGYRDGLLYVHLNMGWAGHGDAWYHLPEIDCDWYRSSSIVDVDYNISPSSTGALLTGRVTSTDGTPLRDAVVEAVSMDATRSTKTDERGIYAFWVDPDRTYRVVATKEEIPSESLSIWVPGGWSRHVEYAGGEIGWEWNTEKGARPANRCAVDLVIGDSIRKPGSLSISGPASIIGGDSAGFSCEARYEDGSSRSVAADWSVVSPETGTIHGNGEAVASNVTSRATMTIRAAYMGLSAEKTIEVFPLPPNDDYADALSLPGTEGRLIASNAGASREVGEPLHDGMEKADTSVWWKWRAPATVEATFVTKGSHLEDTVIAVYTGNAVDDLTRVASNDDVADFDPSSRCSFSATEGMTYYIAVSGTEGRCGMIELAFSSSMTLVDRPANDDFSDAALLEGPSGRVGWDNRKATREEGEPLHLGSESDTSVWGEWVAPWTGDATFTIIGSEFDWKSLIAVYTNGPLSTLRPVVNVAPPYLGDCQSSFRARKGETYYIAVSGIRYVGGQVLLQYAIKPPLPVVIGGDASRPLHPEDGPGVSVENGAFVIRFRSPEAGQTYVLEETTSLDGPFLDAGRFRESTAIDQLIEFKVPLSYDGVRFFRVRSE